MEATDRIGDCSSKRGTHAEVRFAMGNQLEEWLSIPMCTFVGVVDRMHGKR